ncbi:serine/threonine-protein kinase [Microbacterium sp.]|uniref:serine/threonine-protein kinase n=1 Tax=Microbacterium sp. TaxID=51671 RepID=UPI002810EB58|nr:serine/threonine-protein kinase [Microbacterium sp.]
MRAVEETPTAALLGGRYQLGECIGQGGAARVYRADDVLLGRTVAVKLIQAGTEALTAPTRVRNEVAVLASLTHPSLVELYDASIEPGSPCYLVMECIDGPTLAERLREGAPTPAEVKALARDLASALHAVHAAGVVHRDVKPANVLLAPAAVPGSEFRAKLADFGVAFLLDTTRVTNPGTIVGTAAYLPPEQIRGEAATPPGDIYGLGLVLLEALTGERAFPQATGVGAVMARLFDSPHIPEWVDPGWSDLLARMTAAEPKDRPTALDVATSVAALAPPERPASVTPAPYRETATQAEIVPAPAHRPPPPLPLAATKTLPIETPPTSAAATEPVPERRAGSGPAARAVIAAAAALLCIVLAFWTSGADAAGATPSKSLGTPFERVAPTVTDPVVDTPAEPIAPAPGDDDAADDGDASDEKEQEKASEQARKDAEAAQKAEEKAREEAEKAAEKANENDKGGKDD